MATKRTTRKPQAAGKWTPVLDQPPADDQKPRTLAVKNVSNNTYIILADVPGLTDLAVFPQGEAVVADAWAGSKTLRRTLADHPDDFEVEWAGAYDQARRVPAVLDAPEHLRRDLNDRETAFALNLALNRDPAEVVRLIQDTRPSQPTGAGGQREDLKYTKENWRKVLALAEWFEQEIQARKPVLQALTTRKGEIQAL